VATPKAVLDLLGTRIERTAGSPLYRIEAEAARLLGDNKLARTIASRGIAAAAGRNELALDLHLFTAAIDEGEGHLVAALERLEAVQPAGALTGERTVCATALRRRAFVCDDCWARRTMPERTRAH